MQFSEKKKALLQLLADGDFHSGTELADQLNFSRSALWKQINALEDQGVDILAVNGKGYRFKSSLELFDKSCIVDNLTATTRQLISIFDIHDQIDSTNTNLVALSRTSPESTGVVCLAEQQTSGRGRRGRQWVSPFGRNIYCSVLWRFQEGPASLSGLSLAIGVAVIRALSAHGVQGVGLKWPNDIYWQQKKLGGILVEVSGESNGPCSAVIGLGLNLRLSGDEASSIEQDWVDISQILDSSMKISRNELLATLLEKIFQVISHYTEQSFAQYRDEWRLYDCMQGQSVNLFVGKQVVAGAVLGISDDGLLLLQTQDGKVQSYASGEVSFRRS
ncbi:MAG: bifunctional biotin--[acetyl-CoA-carboxylase] ligase/biotin operon repressor BirA [Methylococcaceae bacterium]|nr:bifunctional biotin--[acetyl-CoA-carboxylase] ligase/biotin operon repressor BirA [Methylococcaceae bacterium]